MSGPYNGVHFNKFTYFTKTSQTHNVQVLATAGPEVGSYMDICIKHSFDFRHFIDGERKPYLVRRSNLQSTGKYHCSELAILSTWIHITLETGQNLAPHYHMVLRSPPSLVTSIEQSDIKRQYHSSPPYNRVILEAISLVTSIDQSDIRGTVTVHWLTES